MRESTGAISIPLPCNSTPTYQCPSCPRIGGWVAVLVCSRKGIPSCSLPFSALTIVPRGMYGQELTASSSWSTGYGVNLDTNWASSAGVRYFFLSTIAQDRLTRTRTVPSCPSSHCSTGKISIFVVNFALYSALVAMFLTQIEVQNFRCSAISLALYRKFFF